VSDVLAISVPLGSRYASVNSVGANGHRAGKKSDAYKRLFADVKTAAEAEMARIGWQKASCECFAMIVRYVVTRRRGDASNQGKCELDALTAAGVWDDDSLATPFVSSVCYAPEGGHRLAIVVVKQRQEVPAAKRLGSVGAARPLTPDAVPGGTRTATPSRESVLAAWRPGDPIPDGCAVLGGKLVMLDYAKELIRK